MSAAAFLRGRISADGEDFTRGWAEQRADEARALRGWAEEAGLILDPEIYLDPARRGGEEHMLWHHAATMRYIKLTHAGRFGFAADAEWFFDAGREEAFAKAFLRDATPLEYFDRLLLQNAVFGDDIQLLGIIDKARGMHLVTSQPDIVGDLVTPDEIIACMAASGFERIPAVRLGHEDALAFLRPADRLAVFDCHIGNFVKSGPHIVPIDVIAQHATPELLAALTAHYRPT